MTIGKLNNLDSGKTPTEGIPLLKEADASTRNSSEFGSVFPFGLTHTTRLKRADHRKKTFGVEELVLVGAGGPF